MSYDTNQLDKAYKALPNARIRGLRARWLPPLAMQGFGEWMGELEMAAYGHLEECGWQDIMRDAPPMRRPDGSVDRRWCDAMRKAAGRLADVGRYAGPESSRARWVSWLVYALAEPNRDVKRRLSDSGVAPG